jgi:hypothetical protein
MDEGLSFLMRQWTETQFGGRTSRKGCRILAKRMAVIMVLLAGAMMVTSCKPPPPDSVPKASIRWLCE